MKEENSEVLSSRDPVALIGAGPATADELSAVLRLSGRIVAADGGAETLVSAGHVPDAVIGDFDSLPDALKNRIPADRFHHVAEQDSTDFEKCLTRISAPVVLAAGVSGGRMDHQLAAFSVLARIPYQRCIILGPEDLCFLAPPEIVIELDVGDTVSLFPMGAVKAESEGLHWPVSGLEFDPIGQTGTSNLAEGPVRLVCNSPRMLLLLPRNRLMTVLDALNKAPGWT